MRRTLPLVGLALLGALVRPAAGEDPPARPTPPLQVAAPFAPPPQYDQHDLRQLDPDTLRENAYAAYENNDFFVAIQFQHWAVQQDGEGRYNLACFHARTGGVDGALYWLQQAALEEGLDPEWAEKDPDLEDARRDPRWAQLQTFCREMSQWWAKSGRQQTLLLLPQGHEPGKPIGALIGLHGYGSQPKDFADPDEFQHQADRLGVAIISVSATRPTGPRSYVWAEDPAADLARLRAALTEVAPRVTLDPTRTVLIGFSQGAQVALELAARHPDLFAGAIALSPGALSGSRLKEIPATEPPLGGRGFVISVGAEEEEDNVSLAGADRDQLQQLGARVQHREVAAQKEHVFPADLADRLAEWFAFASGSRQ